MNTTEPYSPMPRAKARVKPDRSAGSISGKITFQKVRTRPAPRIWAASSYWLSNFSSTGWTLRTTKGMPMNTSATVMPRRV